MLGVAAGYRSTKFGLEITGDREIDHDLDRMLGLLARDLSERAPDVFFQRWLVIYPLHNQRMQRAAVSLVDLLHPMLLGFAQHTIAPCRLFHFRHPFRGRSEHHSIPGRNAVVETPSLQREREPAPHREGLSEHLEPSGAASFDPFHAAPMD